MIYYVYMWLMDGLVKAQCSFGCISDQVTSILTCNLVVSLL